MASKQTRPSPADILEVMLPHLQPERPLPKGAHGDYNPPCDIIQIKGYNATALTNVIVVGRRANGVYSMARLYPNSDGTNFIFPDEETLLETIPSPAEVMKLADFPVDSIRFLSEPNCLMETRFSPPWKANQ